MLKLSYFTIFSDQLNSQGDSVLYCTRSSQAFVVNSRIRNLLEAGQFDQLPESVVTTLTDAQGIVREIDNELDEVINENKNFIGDNSASNLYVVIQPSANCQLGCYYCGQNHTKDNLSNINTERILARVEEKIKSGNYKSLFIGWFGGEPLMAIGQIRELTKGFKKITEEHGMTYGCKIVTNGLSLKQGIYREFATELKAKSIEVTLDGTEEFHDTHRYTKAGGKSFSLIYSNLVDIFGLSDYKELGCPISIRCNVDKKNWSSVSKLIEQLASDGLQDKISYFYPIGIYSWGQNDAQNDSLTKEEFAAKEIDWLIEMIDAGFQPKIMPKRQKQVCAVVNPDFEMYDAFGNVFNCTEVSLAKVYEKSGYVLGNLKAPDQISTHKPLVDWNDEVKAGQFPCAKCKMLPVCGGACPKSWHEDMRACPPSKFNIKEKLALAYVQSKSEMVSL